MKDLSHKQKTMLKNLAGNIVLATSFGFYFLVVPFYMLYKLLKLLKIIRGENDSRRK